jgi:hypothetical protein
VRPQSWFTYLSLDAPEQQVTYDLGISTTGVIHLAPYGTPPMAVTAGAHAQVLPAWIPTLPLNTPEWAAGFLISTLVILLAVFWARRRAKSRAKLPVEAS